MLDTEQINDLHRLYWSERWPIRKIERHLQMGWRTIRKYLDAPAQGPALAQRRANSIPSKPPSPNGWRRTRQVTAAVIEQRLRPLGYTGGHSILREYVRKVRPQLAPRRAFVRMEPLAGERFEVDWGHFGALDLLGRHAQALRLRPGRCAQPDAVCRVHSQPELRNLRPLSHACLHRAGRRRARDRLRQSGHRRRRTRWPPGPLSSALPRLRPRIRLLSARLQSGQRLGKRKSRTRHRISAPELLAAARVHRSARCEPPGAAVAGRSRQSAPASRNPRAPAGPLSSRKRCARCRSFLTITATRPKRWSTKISACRSTATATVCPTAMSAGGSPSKPTPVPSPSTIASKRSSAMRAPGGAARPSAPSASRRLLAEERPAARRSQAQQRLLDSLDGLCSRATVEAYLRDMADTDRSLARQISANCWN